MRPSNWASHEIAWTVVESIQGLVHMEHPGGDLKWSLFANKHAKTGCHFDVMGTVFIPIVGAKLLAIGAPKFRGSTGDLTCRHALTSWDPLKANESSIRWEFVILLPGMCLCV